MIEVGKYAVLFQLARTLDTPRANGLHEAARKFELHLLAPLLLKRALAPWRGDVRFVFRHSVREPGEFNFLLSDVDFDLILLRDFAPDEIREINHRLVAARKKFGFIGEAEIYTQSEFAELKELEKNDAGTYGFVRWVRKLRWMELQMETTDVDYHRFKAERSNRVTRDKIARALSGDDLSSSDLSAQVGRWLQDRFDPLPTATGFERPLFSEYLGYWITTPTAPTHERPLLCLPESEAIVLMSILPDKFPSHDWATKLVESLRSRESRLLEAWHQMVSVEWLRNRGWSRSQGIRDPDHAAWMETLRRWMNRINP